MNKLHELLKEERIKQRYSYRSLADKAGINHSTIRCLEVDPSYRAKPDTLKKVAIALNIDSDKLMEMAGYTTHPTKRNSLNVEGDNDKWKPLNEAQRILKEINISNPPIDVYMVAKYLNIKVEDLVGPNHLSGVVGSKKEKAIYVNKAHPKVRQRFTIAHEIGHVVLHGFSESSKKGLLFRMGENHDPKEIEANRFAAELLMPKEMMDMECEKYGESLENHISDLAHKFNVSEAALSIRLATLYSRFF